MARADFRAITFNEHLGDQAGDINAPWAPFMGNQTSVKTFNVDGVPTGEAYVLLQVYDVHSSGHKILVNGTDLAGFDIPQHPAEDRWQTWMDVMESGLLKQGANTIQITRQSGGDNFIVGNVTVNWREQD